MKMQYIVLITICLLCRQGLSTDNEPVFADSLLRHHLESAIFLSGSIGEEDEDMREIQSELIYLHQLFCMREFLERSGEQDEQSYQETNDRIKALITMLERATEDCENHHRVTVINWPEQGVIVDRRDPLCLNLRCLHHFVLQRYAERMHTTPEKISECLAREEYMHESPPHNVVSPDGEAKE